MVNGRTDPAAPYKVGGSVRFSEILGAQRQIRNPPLQSIGILPRASPMPVPTVPGDGSWRSAELWLLIQTSAVHRA